MTAALIGFAALLFDQATKAWSHEHVAESGPVAVTAFFNITAGWNTGVAFGMATFAHPLVLILLGVGISVIFGVFLFRAKSAFEKVALALVIGGALSNVVDRARFGAVRDFVDLHWQSWHWPTFNLADVFIVVGLFSLLLPTENLFRSSSEAKETNIA